MSLFSYLTCGVLLLCALEYSSISVWHSQAVVPTPAGAYQVVLPLVVVAEPYPADNRAFEMELLRLINDMRTAHGLSALREHPALTQAARRHARDMVLHQFAGHTGSDGSSHHDRMVQAGYPGTPWAEAAGLGNPSPQEQLTGWLESPPHRQIILDRTATEIGLGYAANPGALYQHAWTIDLGIGTE